tara:strand:- start:675 stop:845 length:171 start_codon:yes stop_codon:yes gene_type:complete
VVVEEDKREVVVVVLVVSELGQLTSTMVWATLSLSVLVVLDQLLAQIMVLMVGIQN